MLEDLGVNSKVLQLAEALQSPPWLDGIISTSAIGQLVSNEMQDSMRSYALFSIPYFIQSVRHDVRMCRSCTDDAKCPAS